MPSNNQYLSLSNLNHCLSDLTLKVNISAMKITDTRTKWVKFGKITHIAFLGKDAVCFGTGCHLLFINLTTNEELIYTANSPENGDGIRHFSCHSSLNLFAIVENCLNPRIIIKAYPVFQRVCVLENGSPEGYSRILFSECSLLMTLGDLPNYTLTVWNWRRGEKLAARNTGILVPSQKLRCNLSSPVCVTQMGVGTNQVHIWDIFVCGKKCVLTEHVVSSKESDVFTSVLWTSEGTMFLLDKDGCVYMVKTDYNLERVIDFSQSGNITTSFSWYKAGLLINGPNNELRHYKKAGTWSLNWALEPPEEICQIVSSRNDYLLGITMKYHLFHILPTQNEFKYIRKHANEYSDFCLVYPCGEYIIALCHKKLLAVFQVATGQQISCLELTEGPAKMAENPHFPYVAVGYENGILELISVYKPKSLTKMASFYLTKGPINGIYFNDCGRVFIAADISHGQFFILEGLPGGPINIIATVNAQCQIASFAMVLSKDCYRLFTIPVTSHKYVAGNKIMRYCIIKDEETRIKIYESENEPILYQELHTTSKLNRDRVIYAIPVSSRCIQELEIKRGNNFAKISRTITTGHQFKEVHLHLTQHFSVTWSYDGFVVLRCSDFNKNIGFALPHHRQRAGVKKAYVDPHNKYLISLGRENALVCTELMEYELNPQLKQELAFRLNSSAYSALFKEPTIGFMPQGALQGKCWLEVEEFKRIEKERLECARERKSILKDLKTIKKELQELLTKNLEGPDNELLDLLEFNLDEPLYTLKVNNNKNICQATDAYLRELIDEQNRVSKWLKEDFLNKMEVPRTCIKGIFSNFEVENYTILKDNVEFEEKVANAQARRFLQNHLNDDNPFQPWKAMPERTLLADLRKKPYYASEFKKIESIGHLGVGHKTGEEELPESTDTKMAFSGSEMGRFIDIDAARFQQMWIQSFHQNDTECTLAQNDCIRLKKYFNQKFEVMMAQKQKDMVVIKNRNARLRHIISEINYFSTDKIDMLIIDPEWCQEETPDLIKKVADDELCITPYISPSEQMILDAKAAEAERLRLLMLADDFKERALMKMMNGVLEVRWEDELRKDVPVPKCMIDKMPENYNEEDIRIVRDYEEKVKFLDSERQRYKKLLNIEFYKVKSQVKETIRKFNARLSDLLALKLKFEVALGQEAMIMYKIKISGHDRVKYMEKKNQLSATISVNEKNTKEMYDLVSSLYAALTETKNTVESLQARDKLLEKAFKKDFQDMSIVVQEHATKLYKKRPKVNIRLNSATTLSNLAKCIITQKKSLTLPADCMEYLKTMEQFDQYIGIPAPIDEHTFNLICKHRRQRVEYELKCKAAIINQTEGEATISTLHKRMIQKKEYLSHLHDKVIRLRTTILRFLYDMTVQLSVPQGIVEVRRTGRICDFDDAVLVHRQDVERINEIILGEGNKKIQAMQQEMAFRRRIQRMEWEHEKLRMQIEDLKQRIIDIQSIKVTKEMQTYLKARARGFIDRAISFETEVDLLKATYENDLKELRDKEENLRCQIRALEDDNRAVDREIMELNVQVCEVNMDKDHSLEQREKDRLQSRMKVLLKRSKLAEQIQVNHSEILVLQTELELLRLKTFPTLKYKLCK